MPNKIPQERIEALAQEYCNNGFKKVAALLSVGYSTNYANSGRGLAIYDNKRVIEAIDRKNRLKTKQERFTRAQAEIEYDRALVIAEGKKDAQAMIAATRGKAKLYGLEIDTRVNVDLNEGRRPPDPEEARQRNRKRIESSVT